MAPPLAVSHSKKGGEFKSVKSAHMLMMNLVFFQDTSSKPKRLRAKLHRASAPQKIQPTKEVPSGPGQKRKAR